MFGMLDDASVTTLYYEISFLSHYSPLASSHSVCYILVKLVPSRKIERRFTLAREGIKLKKICWLMFLAIGTQIIRVSIGHGGERPLKALWMGGVGVKMQLRNSLLQLSNANDWEKTIAVFWT
jgi:hypothetical protein